MRSYALLAVILVGCSSSSSGDSSSDSGTAADGLVGDVSSDVPGGDATTTDSERPDSISSGDVADSTTSDAPTDSASIASLSDDFTGATLDPSWLFVNKSLLRSYGIASGLYEEPKDGALWYMASQGAAIVKLLSGDFRVTTIAHVRKASDLTATPSTGYQLGGVMARDPASDGSGAPQNYVFVVVGYRTDAAGLVLETKNTVNSVSTDPHPSWPSGDAELRICRRGARFLLYKRTLGATTWTPAIEWTRTDLPATLQVGLVTYSAGAADVRGTFDRIVFAPVASDADCTLD